MMWRKSSNAAGPTKQASSEVAQTRVIAAGKVRWRHPPWKTDSVSVLSWDFLIHKESHIHTLYCSRRLLRFIFERGRTTSITEAGNTSLSMWHRPSSKHVWVGSKKNFVQEVPSYTNEIHYLCSLTQYLQLDRLDNYMLRACGGVLPDYMLQLLIRGLVLFIGWRKCSLDTFNNGIVNCFVLYFRYRTFLLVESLFLHSMTCFTQRKT